MNTTKTLRRILNGNIDKSNIVQENAKILHITGFERAEKYDITLTYSSADVVQKTIDKEDLHTYIVRSKYHPNILDLNFQQMKFDNKQFETLPSTVDFYTLSSGEKLYFL